MGFLYPQRRDCCEQNVVTDFGSRRKCWFAVTLKFLIASSRIMVPSVFSSLYATQLNIRQVLCLFLFSCDELNVIEVLGKSDYQHICITSLIPYLSCQQELLMLDCVFSVSLTLRYNQHDILLPAGKAICCIFFFFSNSVRSDCGPTQELHLWEEFQIDVTRKYAAYWDFLSFISRIK